MRRRQQPMAATRSWWSRNGRGVLCLGESTAESGPRCGEAEEAKRRPAFKLARGEGAGFRRVAPSSARRERDRALLIFRCRERSPSARVSRSELALRRCRGDREGSEQGHFLAADRSPFVDPVHSRAGTHRRILPRAIPRYEVSDAALAEHRAARTRVRRRSARDHQDHPVVPAGGLGPCSSVVATRTRISWSARFASRGSWRSPSPPFCSRRVLSPPPRWPRGSSSRRSTSFSSKSL